MHIYLILFFILTYMIYVFLLIFSFVKINLRIKYILNNNSLNSFLYEDYNILSIIQGLYTFFALLFITLFPLLHFAGYFFVFAFLTEYTEEKILNIIIHKELITFKKEMEENNLRKLFMDNNRFHRVQYRLKFICNYFSNENCCNNLLIFYQFISFKYSLHSVYKNLKEKNPAESNMAFHYSEAANKIEKDINFTFKLIQKYEVLYA